MIAYELFLKYIEENDLDHCVFLAFIRLNEEQRNGDRKLLQELERRQEDNKPYNRLSSA